MRRTRDNAPENLESLIHAVTSRLFLLRHHPSFPDPEFAPDREALNCIRVLTRVLPFIYEKESLEQWGDTLLWAPRRKRTRNSAIANEVLFDGDGVQDAQNRTPVEEFEDAKPLAEELIDTLLDLLFFSDFTVPKAPHGKPKVTHAIWQSGVGCNTSIPTTRDHESNRCEILRLLLTLASQSMYLSPSVLPQQGTKALTYICTCSDKQVVLSVLCSLLNTVSCVISVGLALILTHPRLSNTIQRAGGCLTIISSSKIPRRYWSPTRYSFSWLRYCIPFLSRLASRHQRTTTATSSAASTGPRIFSLSWTE